MNSTDNQPRLDAAKCSTALWLALLICVPGAVADTDTALQAAAGPSNSGRPSAAGGPPLKPGTPAVTQPGNSPRDQGNYGWLFPVLANTKRGNCVVYEVRALVGLTWRLTWSWSIPLVLAAHASGRQSRSVAHPMHSAYEVELHHYKQPAVLHS